MLRYLCSFTLIFANILNAHVLTYDELKDKPNGLAKDYYINRLINEGNYTKDQLHALSNDIYHKSGLVQKNINKILPVKSKPSPCANFNTQNILDADTECQNMLTTIAFSLKLDTQTRTKLAQNLSKIYPQKAQILLTLNATNPATEFAKNMQTAEFLAIFKASDNVRKTQLFSSKFSANFMNALYNEKGFTQLLNDLVMERNFNEFRRNFIRISPQITSQNDAFLLGLNAITLDKTDVAISYFERAKSTFEQDWQRDNATHWIYLISKNKKFLLELAQSNDANIYSLYARDFVKNAKPIEVIVPRPSKMHIENFDITDPFLWQKMTELAKSMNAEQATEFAKKFYTDESLGMYAFFMQKASGWQEQYFLMPKNQELKDVSVHRKSLIYALARQESIFIPSAISTSYALGTMQFMPFLANAIGKKELKIADFDQDDMFKPDVAYKFAKHHLDYLESFLYHPLFIAYAYNGGITFTKKLITRDDMFKPGKFEPFLSLELVPVSETRNYGKKVLANYAIYRALNNSSIKISDFLQNLTQPSLTDRFRK